MTEQEFIAHLTKLLERDEVTPETELEWDSMVIVACMGYVASKTGRSPDPDKLFAAKTVGDVVMAVFA